MDTNNHFVLGASVALAGVAVGAGSVFYASVVAFSGSDATYLKSQPNPRAQSSFTRNDVRRRDAGTIEAADYAERYIISDDEDTHASATNLSENALRRRCARELNLGTRRYNNCMDEAGNGIEYQYDSISR
ncbi:MAG: hypothetical protein O2904_04625 [bacterium]|nr:hypothetical protein [bacterium]